MQIGALSSQTGVNIETIRYYERIGVLPRPDRTATGRRVYSEQDAKRLSFIRHARELGFELRSVKTLLALQEQPEASCEQAARIAEGELAEVEERIAKLLGLRDELRRMVEECHLGKVAECRVMEALIDRAAPRPIQSTPTAGSTGKRHPTI